MLGGFAKFWQRKWESFQRRVAAGRRASSVTRFQLGFMLPFLLQATGRTFHARSLDKDLKIGIFFSLSVT